MNESTESEGVAAGDAERESQAFAAPVPQPALLDDAAPRWFVALAEPAMAIPALTALGVLLFLFNLGGYPVYTKGEAREAVTIFDIVNGGGVILPMRAGVEIPSKPLLSHWLGAIASLALGGVSEWSVRLPSALLAIAGLLVCYGYVRRLFGARPGLLAALILGTTFQYMQAGTGARVDTTLAFFMEIAFFEFLMIAEGITARRWLLYVSIALAVLSKGPVGFILPAAVALAWIAVESRWDVIPGLRVWRGALAVAALAGSWYVAAAIVGGKAFVEKQLVGENLVRFFGGPNFHQGHAHPFYYLELALLGGFLPWTPVLAIPALRALRAPRKSAPRSMYLLIWLAVTLVFYSFAHSKRGVYLLPLYPALAAMVALYLDDAISSPAPTARLNAYLSAAAGSMLALIGLGALLALAMLFVRPAFFSALFAMIGITNPDFFRALEAASLQSLGLTVGVPLATVALGAALLYTRKTAEQMALAVAMGTLLVSLGANAVVVPAIAETLTLEQFSAEVLTAVGDHSVGYLGALDYDVAFYTGRNIPIVPIREIQKTDYLICWRGLYESLPEAERSALEVVLTSNPTALDNTGRMVLLRRAASVPAANDFEVQRPRRRYRGPQIT